MAKFGIETPKKHRLMPNPENLKEPWKEGDPSPNPSGRPKGSRNLSTILREMLNEQIEVVEDGHKKKVTLADALVRKLITNGLKGSGTGSARSITEIFDRVEGKAKQTVDLNARVTKLNFKDAE